jgi:hypothetical protein
LERGLRRDRFTIMERRHRIEGKLRTPPIEEIEHFMACPTCGQYFDLRDFTEAYYHDDDPHEPMKPDA